MPDDTPLTEEELAEIEGRYGSLPEETWVAEAMGSEGYDIFVAQPAQKFPLRVARVGYREWELVKRLALFIAHARTDVPRLVAEVRRLEQTTSRTRPGGSSG
ncbi:MAG: hypothetical protein C4521_12400 [Actinobacteria bacterium]|nr:MAG: hypothetical protein C4521_12400 [Actinomycetota bacterium]